jgi:hypothetical protein
MNSFRFRVPYHVDFSTIMVANDVAAVSRETDGFCHFVVLAKGFQNYKIVGISGNDTG